MSQQQQNRPKIDYASQNEEWMLLCEQNDDGEGEIAESMLVAARVGRLANLQCAMLQEEHGSSKYHALQQLLWHTQDEFDNSLKQPLVGLLAKKDSKEKSTAKPPPAQATSLDIDAFFQEYPECIRDGWGVTGDSDSSGESDGEDENFSSSQASQLKKKSRKKKKSPKKTQRVEKENTGNDVVDLSGAATAAAPPPASRPAPKPSADQENQVPAAAASNPYNKKSSNGMDGSDGVNHNPSTAKDAENNLTQDTAQTTNAFLYTLPSPNSAASSRNGDYNHQGNVGGFQQNLPPVQEQAPPPQMHQGPPSQMPPPQQQQRPNLMQPPSNNGYNGPSNPYQNKQQRPPPPQYQQPQNQWNQPPQYNQGPSHQNQSAWANHVQEQNPFQTAREMSAAGFSNGGRRDQQEENEWKRQQQQQQQRNQQGNNYRQWGQPPPQNGNSNAYGYSYNNNEPEPPAGPVPGGPNIPSPLRQKFRPPGKINGTSNNGNGNQQRRNNNNNNGRVQRPSSSGRNGGGGQRKTSGGNGNAVSAKPSSKKNNDDEEELPEELQHLDKELVLKIQNEIMESGEKVQFSDIAGLESAKQTVLELVVWPMQRPDVFTGLRRAPNGLLLFGPPGTGKTLIGKAIANETKATFFSISSSSLTSKWIGEGEKLVKTLFAVAAYREPAVVFIDEIDSLLTQRSANENEASRRIKTEFLVQLDGAGTSKQGRVLVIGATNRPQELDEAARRRFTKRMYIPLPAENDRQVLLKVMLKGNKNNLTDAQLETLAKRTDGFSGADLKALCTDASMGPIRDLGPDAMDVDEEDIPHISFQHFKTSLRQTRPSVATDDLTQYIEWNKVYGSSRPGEATDDEDSDDDEGDE